MFACGVALRRLSRVPAYAGSRPHSSGVDMTSGPGILDSSLMVLLAMMLGFGRASGKAVHSPMSSRMAQAVGRRGSTVAMRQLVGQMTLRRRKGEIRRDCSKQVLHQSTNRSRFTLASEELCWWRMLAATQSLATLHLTHTVRAATCCG